MILPHDTRAASIAVSHALAVGITTLLISGLLVSAGSYLTHQQQTVARDQFDDIGSDVVDEINTLDRLNGTGETVTVSMQPSYPRTVAGEPYLIEIRTAEPSQPTQGTLLVSTSRMDSPMRFPLNTTTNLNPPGYDTTGAKGGTLTLSLCGPTGTEQAHIRLGECS